MKNTYQKQNNFGLTKQEQHEAIKNGLKIWGIMIVLGFMTVYNLHKAIFVTEYAHANETVEIDPVANFKLPDGPIIIKVGKDPVIGKIKTPRLSEVSAYTSRVQETDDSPCIPADGTNICERHAKGEKMVASNCYKLGSKLDINGTVYTVVDRMNKRYTASCRVDIYMGYDLKGALNHGVKQLIVTEL